MTRFPSLASFVVAWLSCFLINGASAQPADTVDLTPKMLNTLAPRFTLKDPEGRTVDLGELKGKVVVVDFWATWCGPCLMSFPNMQLVVNKYKDDPDVKFFFIDTKEKVENYPELVKKVLDQNHYGFDVLFDEKDGQGKMDKVFSQFGGKFIPMKLVIDRQGTITYQSIGFQPDQKPEDFIREVADAIESAKVHP
jgi:thiol-disulfide isomerase/thioredoxin